MRIRIASIHCSKIIVQAKNRRRRTYWHECRVIFIIFLSALCQVRGRKPVTFFGAYAKLRKATISFSGFGGLEVSVLTSGTQARGFKPGRRRRIFKGEKIRPFLAHSSTFRCCGSLASFQAWWTPDGGSWNVLITGPPGWGFYVPLATARCKNLPVGNTQR